MKKIPPTIESKPFQGTWEWLKDYVLKIRQIYEKLAGTLNVEPLLLSGSGSPEGAVTAPQGAVYSDETSGNLYIKHTGSGNTGWQLLGASGTSLVLRTNGVDNGSQTLLDLVDGNGTHFTDDGSGHVKLDGPTFKTGGTNNSTQSVLDIRAGTGISVGESGGQVTITNTQPGQQLTVDQISPREVWTIGDGHNAAISIGHGDAPASTGSLSGSLVGTVDELPYNRYSATASASTNTVIGLRGPASTVTGVYQVTTILDYTMVVRFNQTSNVRYWWGLSCSSGPGGSATFASDTPNTGYAAFRFSAGTDTNIKAACGPNPNSSSLQTIVDTGVAFDTNVHKYRIVPYASGFKFYIDDVQVADITTNVMSRSDGANRPCNFAVGDNKNTATAISLDWFWSRLTLRT